MTERCNLFCRHCYQHGEKPREIAVEEMMIQIEEAAEMFRDWESEYDISLSPSIHFTGGEPLLFKGIRDVIAHARQNGFGVAILSNGCLIHRKFAEDLASLQVSDIQISLEGPNDIHESIRGPGSFCGALQGVRLLANAGVYVSANLTLSASIWGGLRKR